MVNAPVWKRLIAYGLDVSLLYVPILVFVLKPSYKTYGMTPQYTNLALVISIVVPLMNILYFVVFTYKNKGRTLGKMLLGIQTIAENGKLSLNQIFRRYILLEIGVMMIVPEISKRVFGSIALSFIFHLLYLGAITKDKQKQAPHDKFAGTKVINFKK